MTDKMIKNLKDSADSFVKSMKAEDVAKNATDLANKTLKKAEKGFMGTGLFKRSEEYISSMKNTLFKDGNITDEAIKLYKDNTKAAAGVLGAFTGAVIGCAVLTPIIRDVSAYFVQKGMEKRNPQLKAQPPMLYIDPTHAANNKRKNREPLTMKNYMVSTKGALKV